MIKGFFLGFAVTCIIGWIAFSIYRRFFNPDRSIEIEARTIQKSVENISKLMVVEGHFSEVYSYHETTKIFFSLIPQEKKALLVLNAKAQVGYDLKKIVWEVDKDTKSVIIKSIPKEEVTIIPELRFYDIQTSTFTSFKSEDMNKIQKDAIDRIQEQIEKSDLKSQARHRLVESLQSITSVSSAMGWKMIDKTETVPIWDHTILENRSR